MDLIFSEEQQMFQAAIRKFAEKEVSPIVKEAEENEIFPTDLFHRMGRLGYLCPGFPAELGGGALGKVGDCILVGELAKYSSGIAGAAMIHNGLATLPLLKHATDDQKKRFLLPAIRGEKLAAFGLTEPNAGSDAGAIQTTARREGNFYVINGNKTYITNCEACSFLTLAVSTDKSKGPRGIGTIIVERGTPGFSMTRLKKLGHHSAITGELFFEDCRVPAENLLGEEGKGLRYVLESLAAARISHSARSLGLSEAAFEATLKYAKERAQFGQLIGKFQVIAFKLSRMATEIEAAKALMYRTAWQYDHGNDCRKESAMTKFYSAEVAVKTAEEAMRIHGGAGYMMDSPIQRYYRDAILYPTTEGTQEMQEIVISRELGL